MGWGRMLLWGDLGQQLDINEMRSNIENQEGRDQSQDERIKRLQQENQDLKLAVTALMRMLVAKNVLTSEEVDRVGRAIEG